MDTDLTNAPRSGAKKPAPPRICRSPSVLFGIAAVLVSTPFDFADAHGFAGKRFFPATLTTDDPFVADELSLPTVTSRKTEDGTLGQSASVEISKRITTDFGIGFGATYLRLRPATDATQNGFDNFALSAKYQFYKSDGHETILSVGADWDIGSSGSTRVGAEPFSTVTPSVFFGKGFGDLPESARYLRPFALTGSAGIGLPSRSSSTTFDDSGIASTEQHPNVLTLGLALEYSIPYLQSFVKDAGLRAPFNGIIPIVEVAFDKPLDRGGGPWVGTVNPGLLFTDRRMQFGIEAVIPAGRTRGKTGVIAQLHFFLDDLFPTSLGKPLLGR